MIKPKFSQPTRKPKAIQLHDRTIVGLAYGADETGLGFIEVSNLSYRGHAIVYPEGKRRGLQLKELHAELTAIVDLCRAAVGQSTMDDCEVEIETVVANCTTQLNSKLSSTEVAALANAGLYAVKLIMATLVDHDFQCDELLFNVTAIRLHKALAANAERTAA